jgi:2-iminobutanoate/2-iminopropanoate deaminase
MFKTITTTKAPKAIGPYSQAVVSGDTIYVSGQLPINPEKNELLKGSMSNLTDQILTNIKEILMEGGFSLENVTMVNVYMTDLSKFDELNRTYENYFGKTKPARVAVCVASLPKGAELEISVIAKKEA